MRFVETVSVPVVTLTAVDLIEFCSVLLGFLTLPVHRVLFLVVSLVELHGTNIMNVREVGLEPTCDQLPFLQGISLRGYSRLRLSSFVCSYPMAVSASYFALSNLFFNFC